MKLFIEQKGIANTNSDVVVNAANSSLIQGGGVCGVIFKAAGSKELTEACEKIGHCKTGDAVITPGFKLAKYIIHAVGPIYKDGKHHEPQELYSCYKKALDLAYEHNCRSITFPLLSAGIYAYPADKAFKKALEALNDWNKENDNPDIDVIFAIPEDYKYQIGLATAKDLGIVVNKD